MQIHWNTSAPWTVDWSIHSIVRQLINPSQIKDQWVSQTRQTNSTKQPLRSLAYKRTERGMASKQGGCILDILLMRRMESPLVLPTAFTWSLLITDRRVCNQAKQVLGQSKLALSPNKCFHELNIWNTNMLHRLLDLSKIQPHGFLMKTRHFKMSCFSSLCQYSATKMDNIVV